MFRGYPEFKQSLHERQSWNRYRTRTTPQLKPLRKQPAYSSTVLSENELNKLLESIKTGSTQVIFLSGRLVNDNQFVRLMEAISTLGSKKLELYLSDNLITDNGIRWALPSIEKCTGLLKLELSLNKLSDEGAKWLLGALQGNISLVNLNLIGNVLQELTFALSERLVERNREIQEERERMPYYVAVAVFSRKMSFPVEITNLLLDHICEASNPEARAYLAKIYYRQAVNRADQLSSAELEEISISTLFEETTNTVDLNLKMLAVKLQYEPLDSSIDLDETRGESAGQVFTPLLAHSSKESLKGRDSSSDVRLQRSNVRGQSFSCGCTIA